MKRIMKMAMKDIKLIVRDRLGLFFIAIFPILMGLFFGLVMQINLNSGSSKLKVAIVDQDQSEISKSFVESLRKNQQLDLQSDEVESAKESVRKGDRVGMIILPPGFGEKAGVFWNEPPDIQLGLDPSRGAETAMLQGFIMQAVGELIGIRFQNPEQFKPFLDQTREDIESSESISPTQRTILTTLMGTFDSMIDSIEELQEDESGDGDTAMGGGMQFANVETIDVSRTIDPKSIQGQLRKIRSRWDISFPQAMMWGVLGCVAGFAISIARERTLGTLLRLQVAPINRSEILAGKAMACFLTVMAVVIMLTAIGVGLGMRPASYPKLGVASLCIAFCFVGIMMVMSVLGKTEQGVSGAGWALNMVMAMFGGCMIPAMFLPGFMKQLSSLSPVKWSIQAIEGAVWREFTWAEMAIPYGILILFGTAGLVVGTLIMNRQDR